MKQLCRTFSVAQILDQSYWDGWNPSVPVIPVRLTIFRDGMPYGVGAFDYTPRTGEDGARVLEEGDMDFIRSTLMSGIRMNLSGAGIPEDSVECAQGSHNHTFPPRAAVGGWVIERDSLPLVISSSGVVSYLLSGGPMSIKNLGTGLQYEDMEAPEGEDFALNLPVGNYRASIWPRDLRYAFTEVDFEID